MASERGGTETRDMRIVPLLDMLDQQKIVLPEFQRAFDWDDDRVKQLLATLTRRWPAGSLLLQQFPGETFYKLRGFDGGPAVDEDKVVHVVLDGQQRLTALYHAIYDAGPYVYAIRASALTAEASIDQLEDGIASFSREEWNAERRDQPFSHRHDWIPFYSLRSPADYFGWRDLAVEGADPESRPEARMLLSNAYRNGLEAFHTYMLPAVVVDRELEPEAIARIFERVNRGGLALTAFDLMVAKTFESGWNLREKWDEARSIHPILEEFFGDDGMPVIRVVALKARGSVRERDVLGLEGLAVRHDWSESVAATASVLTFLRASCGVRRRDWLPYDSMVITLAAVALEFDLAAHDRTLRQWFLSRAFGLTYDTAANTVAVEQYRHLREVLRGETRLRPVPIASVVLREATRKRRAALWRTFLAALAMRGARDPITGLLIEEPRPVSVLPRQERPPPGTESAHLLILGLVLAERDHVRLLERGGVAGLATHLGELPLETAADVAHTQLLDHFQISSGNELTQVEQLVTMRLHALDRWLGDQLGYGLDSTRHGETPLL
jgi:hypothetical protein